MKSVQRLVKSATMGVVLGVVVGSLLYVVFSGDRNRSLQIDSTAPDSSQLVVADRNDEEDQESQTRSSDWVWLDGIESRQAYDISTFVANVDANELQTVVDQVLTQPWSPRLLAVKKLIFGKLAQLAPRDALNRVFKSSTTNTFDLVDVVFREWSVQNFRDALASAIELGQPYRDIAFNAIVSEHDLASRKLVGEAPDSDELKSFLDKWEAEVVILELMQTPVEAARQLLNDDIPDRAQIALLEDVVDAWQPPMGFEILNVLLDQLYSTDSRLSVELVARVISADPAAAMDHVTSGKRVKRRAMLGRLLLNEYWSEIGALNTLDAAQELENIGLGDIYVPEFLSTWGREEPLGLLNQIDQIPLVRRHYAVGVALRKLAERDIGNATRWFESLKSVPGATTEFAESELVQGWAVSNPEGAFEWLLENSEERSPKRSFLTQMILLEYAENDPEGAVEFAKKHGLSPPR